MTVPTIGNRNRRLMPTPRGRVAERCPGPVAAPTAGRGTGHPTSRSHSRKPPSRPWPRFSDCRGWTPTGCHLRMLNSGAGQRPRSTAVRRSPSAASRASRTGSLLGRTPLGERARRTGPLTRRTAKRHARGDRAEPDRLHRALASARRVRGAAVLAAAPVGQAQRATANQNRTDERRRPRRVVLVPTPRLLASYLRTGQAARPPTRSSSRLSAVTPRCRRAIGRLPARRGRAPRREAGGQPRRWVRVSSPAAGRVA